MADATFLYIESGSSFLYVPRRCPSLADDLLYGPSMQRLIFENLRKQDRDPRREESVFSKSPDGESIAIIDFDKQELALTVHCYGMDVARRIFLQLLSIAWEGWTVRWLHGIYRELNERLGRQSLSPSPNYISPLDEYFGLAPTRTDISNHWITFKSEAGDYRDFFLNKGSVPYLLRLGPALLKRLTATHGFDYNTCPGEWLSPMKKFLSLGGRYWVDGSLYLNAQNKEIHFNPCADEFDPVCPVDPALQALWPDWKLYNQIGGWIDHAKLTGRPFRPELWGQPECIAEHLNNLSYAAELRMDFSSEVRNRMTLNSPQKLNSTRDTTSGMSEYFIRLQCIWLERKRRGDYGEMP